MVFDWTAPQQDPDFVGLLFFVLPVTFQHLANFVVFWAFQQEKAVTSARESFQGHHLGRNKISLGLIETVGIYTATLIIENRSGEITTQ